MPSHSPDPRVAMVTGAGTGLGRAAAIALAGAGYAVALVGRRREPIDAVATEIRAQQGAAARAYPADLTRPAEIEALFAQVAADFGRLDVLFNNAGIGAAASSVEDLPLEAWQAVVATNLTAPFLCTQAAIRVMKAQSPPGGRIINNGSISAQMPRPLTVAYTVTKHAISGLTKQTALDCRGSGIACSQIDIGNAATPLVESLRAGGGMLQANGDRAQEPVFDPAEVGRAIVHIASLPLDTNVLFMTLMATDMPYVGRG